MSKGTLVIVDDDRSFVEAVSLLLEDEGYRPLKALGGREGIELLQANSVDLAIIDVHMPDVSGIDVARAIRQQGREVPIILISSDDHPDVLSACESAGVKVFLPKPLDPEKLLGMIDHTLALHR